jgi:hypothetical protein
MIYNHNVYSLVSFEHRKDEIVPSEMPDLEDIRRKRQDAWVQTRTQLALMLVAAFSGYIRWPMLYLLLLAFAWISLEADRRVALGLPLRWDPSYWVWVILTTIFFLLGAFEAGRFISWLCEYLYG